MLRPNRGYSPCSRAFPLRRRPRRRGALLTETGLCDEVPGHGEHVLLARLVVADVLGIHLGGGCVLSTIRLTLARYPSLLARTAEAYCFLRRCVGGEREKE
jgi:hypothetical protein